MRLISLSEQHAVASGEATTVVMKAGGLSLPPTTLPIQDHDPLFRLQNTTNFRHRQWEQSATRAVRTYSDYGTPNEPEMLKS